MYFGHFVTWVSSFIFFPISVSDGGSHEVSQQGNSDIVYFMPAHVNMIWASTRQNLFSGSLKSETQTSLRSYRD